MNGQASVGQIAYTKNGRIHTKIYSTIQSHQLQTCVKFHPNNPKGYGENRLLNKHEIIIVIIITLIRNSSSNSTSSTNICAIIAVTTAPLNHHQHHHHYHHCRYHPHYPPSSK